MAINVKMQESLDRLEKAGGVVKIPAGFFLWFRGPDLHNSYGRVLMAGLNHAREEFRFGLEEDGALQLWRRIVDTHEGNQVAAENDDWDDYSHGCPPFCPPPDCPPNC